jgi:glycosyltransferase involved in cell wall biosynthesis
MNKRMNLVFMGIFPYPQGMAGTKRIQHTIDAFKTDPEVEMRVIVLYQPAKSNLLRGIHAGTVYETVLGDLSGIKRTLFLPLLYLRTVLSLRRAYRSGYKNILYNYGPISADNVIPLRYAKDLGYKIILDIVEDYEAANCISSTSLKRLKVVATNWLSPETVNIASGIVVISEHLKRKYTGLTRGQVPVHYRPISVRMDRIPIRKRNNESAVSLFYAGSFGKKEGLSVLIDAFDSLAVDNKAVRLVLTGQGTAEDMRAFSSRVKGSPFRDRIGYKGYLEDDEYYETLCASDIPCMTRTDLAYAHGGFPFKLGEYLASGKPVVASRVSDVGLFLTDRDNAMLVKPGDSEAIVNAVKYLVDHPDISRMIGERGRKTAASHFEYKHQGDALLSYIKAL